MQDHTAATSPAPARDAYDVLQVSPVAHQQVVRAAYRALARLHHPDADVSPGATARMAELNGAYSSLFTPERRAEYDRRRVVVRTNIPVNDSVPATPVAPRPKPAADIIDFGRYAGWRIIDLSRQDPDYLRWLSRHSSGIRYRRTIAEALDRQSAVAGAAPARRR